jgi:hypothetical protein
MTSAIYTAKNVEPHFLPGDIAQCDFRRKNNCPGTSGAAPPHERSGCGTEMDPGEYARVSTDGQSLESQLYQLQGCCRVFAEKISGAVTERPALK